MAPQRLTLVYPAPNHETAEAATFVLGQAPMGWQKLWIQRNQAPRQAAVLSPQGYFAARVPLPVGDNHLTFWETAEGGTTPLSRLNIRRKSPTAALPAHPLAYDASTISPKTPVSLLPGDWLTLRAWVSPGCKASVRLPGLLDAWQPLRVEQGDTAEAPDTREAVFAQLHQTQPALPRAGMAHGMLKVPADATPGTYALAWRLEDPSGQATPLGWTQPGQVTVWAQPRVARLGPGIPIQGDPSSPDIVMRTMPETGARWTPQTGAPWVWVNRIEAGWARLALDVEDVAWAKTSDVGWQAQTDVPVPRLAVARLSATTQPHVARLCLPLAQPVPVILQGQPQQLTLRIFGAVSACDFIRQDPQLAAWVDDLRIEQEGPQTVRVTLGFSRSLAGYHHAWEWDAALESQALVVTFRTLPPQPHQWRIGIDPGHGGTEPGGHGPDGTPEKTLNLQLAQRLAQALTAAGCAHVLLSRQQDQTLSLTQRTQWAKNQGLDILLSLHHNALPDGRDPLRVYGSSVFYYQPFARPWAFHLWEAICPISSTPPSGLPEATGPMQRALADAVYFDSLAVTRPSHCLALLIEAGYLTHPWDYERLQSPDYCHRWVQALAGGILAAGGLAKGGKPMPVMLY